MHSNLTYYPDFFMRLYLFILLIALSSVYIYTFFQGSKASKWAELIEYEIGDLNFTAPNIMTGNEYENPLFKTQKRKVDRLDLNLTEGPNRVGVPRIELTCNKMKNGWAKDVCKAPPFFIAGLPSDGFELFNGELPSRLKILTELPQFDLSVVPMLVACEGRLLKKRCHVIFQLTDSVFVTWSFYGTSGVLAEEEFVQKIIKEVCVEGRAIHDWFTISLKKEPIYGSSQPSCPHQVFLHS